MAVTGIGYRYSYLYERQNNARQQPASEEESSFAENVEEGISTPVTRGVRFARHLDGKGSVPYEGMAKDGVIEYNGVTFNCDYDHNRICLGDTSNLNDCITIPLSEGGSLVVNRDNLNDLSRAIGMFSPEDVERILRALARDRKLKQMQTELDDMSNSVGEAEDRVEEKESGTEESTGTESSSTEETTSIERSVVAQSTGTERSVAAQTTGTEKSGGASETGNAGKNEEDSDEIEESDIERQIQEKMQQLYEKIKNGDDEEEFQIGNQSFTIKEWKTFLDRFDSVQDAIRQALTERIEKEKEKQLKNELLSRQEHTEEERVEDVLAQSVKSYGPEEDAQGKTWYITCYTEEGIWCKKCVQGGESEDLWRIPFTDASQYRKVAEYLNHLGEEEDVSFASDEAFWRAFLEDDKQ